MPLTPTPPPDESVILVHAEDVRVSRRTLTHGTLRAQLATQENPHHVNEDLLQVRVEVERVPIGRRVDAIPPTREEGDTTILSVVEEIVVVERHFVLKEEVHIRRIEVIEHHHEVVVVREQSVEISHVEAPSLTREIDS